jgi:1,4-dihydroxy-2-naphthoate octaprenyltransferase
MRWLGIRLRALRAFSFPLSTVPVLVATALVRAPGQWNWPILAASVAGALLLHAFGNLLNDYFDFRAGVDSREEEDESRPGRLLVRGEMTPREVLFEALACACALVPIGLYLLVHAGTGLVWYAAAAFFAGYSYTGPPFRFKYHALGDFVIFATFGPLLMGGAAYAQTGRHEPLVFLLSIPVGLVTTGVLVGNNIRDLDEDRAAGVRTLERTIGRRVSGAFYALSVCAPPLLVAGFAAAGMIPAATLFCLALVPLAVRLVVKVLREPRVPDVDVRTSQFALVFMVALTVGILIRV